MTTDKVAVITLVHDLLLYILPVLERVPQKYKYWLGERIVKMVVDILEDLIEAYYVQGIDKKRALQKANIRLEKLRHLIRIGHTLECFNVHKYEVISKRINEIGVQVGGWIKTANS